MTPLQKFVIGLRAAKQEHNETLDELLAFAEIMANKQNTLDMDENGFFYVTATGPLDGVISTIYKQLERLERIQKQKDNPA